jgi:hypothetical protein
VDTLTACRESCDNPKACASTGIYWLVTTQKHSSCRQLCNFDDDLADVLLALKVLIRLQSLLEPEHAINDGLELVDFDQAVHVPEPTCALAAARNYARLIDALVNRADKNPTKESPLGVHLTRSLTDVRCACDEADHVNVPAKANGGH